MKYKLTVTAEHMIALLACILWFLGGEFAIAVTKFDLVMMPMLLIFSWLVFRLLLFWKLSGRIRHKIDLSGRVKQSS